MRKFNTKLILKHTFRKVLIRRNFRNFLFQHQSGTKIIFIILIYKFIIILQIYGIFDCCILKRHK